MLDYYFSFMNIFSIGIISHINFDGNMFGRNGKFRRKEEEPQDREPMMLILGFPLLYPPSNHIPQGTSQ